MGLNQISVKYADENSNPTSLAHLAAIVHLIVVSSQSHAHLLFYIKIKFSWTPHFVFLQVLDIAYKKSWDINFKSGKYFS